MSETSLALSPQFIAESKSLAKDLSTAQSLPMALKQKPADILAIVLTGAELGLAPMQAIRGIHIIDGKASLSSGLMAALVKRSPTCEFLSIVESTDKIATLKTRRKGEPGETVMSFTIEQAKTAGLTGKQNWAKYPQAMLLARVQAMICRAVYPDLCLGLYDSDSGELERSEPVGQIADSVQAHAVQVKEQLKAAVVQPKKEEITDAVFVDTEPQTPVEQVTIDQRIAAATDLRALLPEIQAHTKVHPNDRERLLAAYTARKNELEKK